MDHTLRLTLAQTTLAKKLGLSRQWVGELVHRLDEAGWLVHVSPVLPDGTNGPTIFMIGRQLTRVLIILTKTKRRKRPTKEAAKCRWHFSGIVNLMITKYDIIQYRGIKKIMTATYRGHVRL